MSRTRSNHYDYPQDTPMYETSRRGEVEDRPGYGDRGTRQIDNYYTNHAGRGPVIPYRGPSPLIQRHPAAALAYRNPYTASTQQIYPLHTPVTNYSSQPGSHPAVYLPQHHHHAHHAYQEFHPPRPPPSQSVSPERSPRKSAYPERSPRKSLSPEISPKHNTVSVSLPRSKPVKAYKKVKVTKEDLISLMEIPAKTEPDTRGRGARERSREVEKKTVVEVKTKKINDKPEKTFKRKEPQGSKHRRHSKKRSRRRDNDHQDSEDRQFAYKNNHSRERRHGKYIRNSSEEEDIHGSDSDSDSDSSESESESEMRNDSRRRRRHQEETFDSERRDTRSAYRSRSPRQRSRGRRRYDQDQHDSVEVGYGDEPWYVQASSVVQESCPALDCGDGTDSDSGTENYETQRGKRSHNKRRNPKSINCCSEIVVPPWLCCVVAVVGCSML